MTLRYINHVYDVLYNSLPKNNLLCCEKLSTCQKCLAIFLLWQNCLILFFIIFESVVIFDAEYRRVTNGTLTCCLMMAFLNFSYVRYFRVHNVEAYGNCKTGFDDGSWIGDACNTGGQRGGRLTLKSVCSRSIA